MNSCDERETNKLNSKKKKNDKMYQKLFFIRHKHFFDRSAARVEEKKNEKLNIIAK